MGGGELCSGSPLLGKGKVTPLIVFSFLGETISLCPIMRPSTGLPTLTVLVIVVQLQNVGILSIRMFLAFAVLFGPESGAISV